MDSKKSNNLINEYKNYKIEEDKENKILAIKQNAYNEFVEKCENDKSLSEKINEYKPIAEVLDYSIEKDENFFMEYTQYADLNAFSDELYDEYKFIYDKWPQAKDEVENEINKLQKSTFVLHKKDKLETLKNKLFDVKFAYNAIKNSLEKENLKNNLLKQQNEKIKTLVSSIKETENKYAMEVAKKYVLKNPEINTVNTILKNNETSKNKYSVEVLNNAFNKVKELSNTSEKTM